jgi:murein DD-endopeptidase MepM/ murein hydrolase activator NlpD
MVCSARSFGNRWLHAVAGSLRVCLTTTQRWSRTAQAVALGLVFALAAWLTVTTISFVSSQSLLSESAARVRDLQEAYADLASDARVATAGYLERIEALQRQVAQQEAAITQLASAKASLNREIEERERRLASLVEQRDEARGLVDDMRRSVAGVENLLAAAAEERAALRRQLKSTEEQMVEISDQRDAGRRVEVGLRWRLARLEDEIERLLSHRESAQLWLRDWVLGSVEALEEVVDQTGIDVEKLIARATNASASGQGGPLQVTAPDEIGWVAEPSTTDPMSGDIERLALLQRIAAILPLSSPLDQFHVTSPYGKRRDPFTGTLAYHSGLDLGAPRDSKVLAPAPGQIVFAGRSGPYGNMVEIDHGMGIVTRYAHLKSIDVEVGEGVEYRQIIGVLGSSGRSTSRHLHYEIRIDDRLLDPTNFLDAGRRMVGIFDVSGREKVE